MLTRCTLQAAQEADDVLCKSLVSLPELDSFLEQEASLLLVLLYEVQLTGGLLSDWIALDS